jgi:hypothetical protein
LGIVENIATLRPLQGVYQGLQGIFKNIISENCNNKDAILKEAFKSAVVIGGSVAGAALGGSATGQATAALASIGTEVILQFVEFMNKKAKELTKLADIEKNENFENAVAFLNVQEEDCNNKYNTDEMLTSNCRKKTAEELEEENKLVNDTKNIFKILDDFSMDTNFGDKAGPEGVALLKKLLQSYNMKTALSGEEKMLKKILDDAVKAYDDSNDLKKYATLAKIVNAINESGKMVEKWEVLRKRLMDSAADDKDALVKFKEVDSMIANHLTTFTGNKD